MVSSWSTKITYYLMVPVQNNMKKAMYIEQIMTSKTSGFKMHSEYSKNLQTVYQNAIVWKQFFPGSLRCFLVTVEFRSNLPEYNKEAKNLKAIYTAIRRFKEKVK